MTPDQESARLVRKARFEPDLSTQLRIVRRAAEVEIGAGGTHVEHAALVDARAAELRVLVTDIR